MAPALSPYRLGKARETYNLFNVFNSLSWSFLAGNIITLIAMRIGASSTYLGALNALSYAAFFFLPAGKLLARRFSIVKIFSTAWMSRAIGMGSLLFVPLAVSRGHRDLALGLILLGVALFHTIRGIGMIGNNPVLSLMASGPDRGSYMTQIQILNSAVGMFSGFVLAMILGREPPLFLYSIIMAAGIGCGVFSGLLMRKIPDPPGGEEGKGIRLAGTVRRALGDPSLKRFILILFFTALVSGVSRAFIIVYSREVFFQSDGMVSLFSVFGGLGNLMIGLLIKFLVDRVGAKPIFIICVITGLIAMIPVVFFPRGAGENFTTVTLFLTFLFFVINFGFLGAEGIGQTYFLSLVPSEMMLDMGILYFFVFGIAGSGGSVLGGLFLDILAALGLSRFLAFKALYLVLIGITIFILALQRKLAPLEALPFKGALGVIFSYRDLRAITLLDRLDRTNDSHEEEALLGALHDSPSRLAVKGLLTRARSPRLATRLESIRALENLKTLDEAALRALMDDMINNPYTTAYISARILGNHGVSAAIPVLRELAGSRDYMLAGEAMIALAKLGDEAFRPRIERLILKTKNPRLKIMGVEAFGIYGSPHSLPALLDILRAADPPPYLRDEVSLAMAAILDLQNQFYPLLVRFLEDESLGPTLALDEAEAASEYYHSLHRGRRRAPSTAGAKQARTLLGAVASYARDLEGAALSRWILELPDDLVQTAVQVVLAEAVLDDELVKLGRLRLLISHWAARELRLLADKPGA